MKQTLLLLICLCFVTAVAGAQDRTITGTVTGKDGSALTGAVVQVKGTSIGTFTKAGGKYKITAPGSASALIFKLVGKKTKEVTIGSSDVIDVVLEEDAVHADEVVVTAIGLERQQKELGYSLQGVSGDALVQSRESNVVNAISSKVAGVQVINSSGSPGGSSYIRIRGSQSITGNNQPLFVVDGIPIDNSQNYSGNPDNGENNLLSSVNFSNRAIDLNSDDIENISVLKGPAATALYGIRAAGGAVLITTKKGRPSVGERVNVNLTTSVGFDQVNKLPELQTQFSQGGGGRYSAPAPGASRSWGAAIDTLYWDGNSSYKWDPNGAVITKQQYDALSDADKAKAKPVTPYDQYEFFQTGTTWNTGLNMSGGTEMANYLLSFGYLTQTGVVPLSDWTRGTIRASGMAQISNTFRAAGNMTYINSGGTRIQQGSNTSGVMLGLTRTPPTFDNGAGVDDPVNTSSAYRFADGTQRTYRGGVGYDNPYWTVNLNQLSDRVNRFLGNVQFDWTLGNGLDLLYRIGGDVYSDVRHQEFAINSRTNPAGQVFEDQWTNRDLTQDIILTWTKDWSTEFSTRLLVGNNLFDSYSQQVYVQGDGLGSDGFYHISNTEGQITREREAQLRRAAWYGDLTLSFHNALFLNITGRNEWSTTLPEANNSFFYPSFALSAVLTDLLDLQSDVLSFLKLRASWAQVGKDAPVYSTVTTFSQANYSDGWTNGISFPYNGSIGFMLGNTIGSPDLKPESTTSIEIGFDVRFFDNRLGLDFTWYDMTSEDQIFAVPLAGSTGFLSEIRNAGSIQNSGIEFVLTATPILTTLGDSEFRWDFTTNFTMNKNQVVSLAPGVDNIFLGGFEGSSIRAVAGQPYGTIYGFGWVRDDKGNVVIDSDPDSDNYGYPILDPIEKAFGSSNPDWLMGITNTFSWNGVSLSFLFDIRQGGVLWNGTRSALYFFGTHEETAARGATTVFEGVKGTIDPATGEVIATDEQNDIVAVLDENWWAFGNGNGFIGSNTEDFIEDVSWVRLRELTVAYSFPASIMSSTPFSGLTLAFTGRNLWLSTDYTGVDPETNLQGSTNAQGIDYFNMPSTRSYNFSLALSF
jgi:TonB-linked SusC/RagA family outer membrane protein